MDDSKYGFKAFLELLQDKYFVCVGIGKLFERYLDFMMDKDICGRIVALVDNDTNKHGRLVDVGMQTLHIINMEELATMRQDEDFLILVTSSYYKEICEQIENYHGLCGLKVVNAFYMLRNQEDYLAVYTDLFKESGKDIGENGSNMTISVLMHNRVELTLRLLDSIQKYMPKYRGEVLLGDNGSDENEIELLKTRLKYVNFRHKLLLFDQHYPIPEGKNRLNEECRTDWILQLDNDIYFTGNPLDKINEDIRRTGCRLWGLPYYDTKEGRVANYGSNLEFVLDETRKKHLTCLVDLPFDQKEEKWQPMLCTYAAGCAKLMERKLFLALGKYDENLFMCEDIDFMYRANIQGYKIGSIGMKCLVHDHRKIDSEHGRQYEAVRYDNDRMRLSREYLKQKYGFAVG